MSSELERAVSRCLLPSFRETDVPDWLRPWLARGLGGVVLFGRNIESREQLCSLTGALRSERPDLLVALDEEGGDVTRLEAGSGSSYPGNCALGVVDDVDLTEAVAASIGAELRAVGVTLDLAPVADVNSNPANPVIGVRSFGGEAGLVARHVAAFVRGLQEAGVAACAKHFPGHGDTKADSHLELPVVRADPETLRVRELVPFRAAVDAGVRAVMTAHISVPALDPAPATVSREVIEGVLRGELGFQGLVVTDALEMRGISSVLGVEEAAVAALWAGADALCLGALLGAETVERVHAGVLAAVRSGRLAEERVHEAAGRVEATAEWASSAGPSVSPDGAVGVAAARRALAVEGRTELRRPPLVVELVPEASIAAGEAGFGLGEALRRREPATEVVRARSSSPSPRGAVREGDADRLVVCVRDAHRYEWERTIAEALLETAGGGVVVETGIAVWRPKRATGYVASYGSGRVNLEAAAERLLS